ncbi:MAG TPA: response regulator [Nitrospirota bacterium]|nr:response regulator [Nitrospirota bacterium]
MKKLLIVDDSILILSALSRTFRDNETEVMTASNGQTALHAINKNCFDLCILDIHLPDMNGLEIMKLIRTVSPTTRVVIITGSAVSDSMMQSVRENASCLLCKPFELDKIRLIVNRLLTTNKYQDECVGFVDLAFFTG